MKIGDGVAIEIDDVTSPLDPSAEAPKLTGVQHPANSSLIIARGPSLASLPSATRSFLRAGVRSHRRSRGLPSIWLGWYTTGPGSGLMAQRFLRRGTALELGPERAVVALDDRRRTQAGADGERACRHMGYPPRSASTTMPSGATPATETGSDAPLVELHDRQSTAQLAMSSGAPPTASGTT